jgi:hypothetical protein
MCCASTNKDHHELAYAMSDVQISQGPRKIVIDPVTRVEGHGKVTIRLNEAGEVEQARFHIVEFRGFERFIQGRMYWEVPVIVQRLCGICPVSHHLCAAKAMDVIAGVDQVTPTAEKMRRLMHYGQVLQSNAVNFFHLASPDLLLGFEAPVAQRNIIGVIEAFPVVGASIRGCASRAVSTRTCRWNAGMHSGKILIRSSSGAATRSSCTSLLSTLMRNCTRPSRASRRAI